MIRVKLGKAASVCAAAAFCLAAHSATLDIKQFPKEITFTASGYDGSSTLENFPVLVRFSEDIFDFKYSDIGTTAAEAYSKLRFADADGKNLDYEIETWDTTGVSHVWVSLPSLSGKNTEFSAYYDADVSYTLPDIYPTNVWTSAGYVAVWHMKKRVADDTWRWIYEDSTGRGSPAHGVKTMAEDGGWTISDASSYEPLANGTPFFSTSVGGPRHLLATGDVANWDFETTGYSAEAWFSVPTPNWITIFAGGAVSGEGTNTIAFSQNTLKMTMYTSSSKQASSVIPSDGWNYITAVWKGSESSLETSRLYAVTNGSDRVEILARPAGGACNPNDGAFGLTGTNAGSGSRGEDMDEIRVRKGESSADWVQANWDVQRVDTDFLEYSAVHNPSDEIAMMAFSVASLDETAVSVEAHYEVGSSIDGEIDVYATLVCGDVETSLGKVGAISTQSGDVSIAKDGLFPGTEYGVYLSMEYGGESHVSSTLQFTMEPLTAPAVSGISASAATATGAFTITGASYTGGKAVVTDMATRTETEFAIADLSAPSVTLALSENSDYTVKFVFSRSDGATVSTPVSVPFYTPLTATFDPTVYLRSMTFTASGYDGASTLENFPVLVRLSEATVPGFLYKEAKKDDVRFTDASGNLLPFEVENWNQDGYTAIWVSVPALSGTDTSFTMYWRPKSWATTVAAPPSCRVWSKAGYAGVWHFNERKGTATSSYCYAYDNLYGHYYPDSSGWGRDAAKGSTWWPSTLISPTNDVANAANGTSWHDASTPSFVPDTAWSGTDTSATGYSAETWVNPRAAATGLHTLFADCTNYLTSANILFCNKAQIRLTSKSYSPTYYMKNDQSDVDGWRFIVANWTAQGDASLPAVYAAMIDSKDGPAYVGTPTSGSRAADLREHGIGLTSWTSINEESSSGGATFYVDEMRIRIGTSSLDWIQANWDVQRMGSDFLSPGEVKSRANGFILTIK